MIVLVSSFFKNHLTKAQLILGFLFLFHSCSVRYDSHTISGNTMGTTYLIKLVFNDNDLDKRKIEDSIDSILFNLNQQMSTWIKGSEISLFNKNMSLQPQIISDDFFYVLKQGQLIYQESEGLFDYTIFPIMDLWGFGPFANKKEKIPNKDEIKDVLDFIGIDKIELNYPYVKKLHPKLQLDLNAIAKGYAVDKIYNWLIDKGFSNIFVEIGGEIRCGGINKLNNPWLVGIDTPLKDSFPGQKIAAKTILKNKALATSGNYRNFRIENNRVINHTFNPISGLPVETNVLSVSVKSDECLIADAWATALMVLPYEEGMEKVKNNEVIEVLWVISEDDNSLKYYHTKDFFY